MYPSSLFKSYLLDLGDNSLKLSLNFSLFCSQDSDSLLMMIFLGYRSGYFIFPDQFIIVVCSPKTMNGTRIITNVITFMNFPQTNDTV